MPDAQLSDQSIHCSDLYSRPTAHGAQIGCGDVVFSIWLDQRERTETADDLGSRLRRHKSLKQFLKHQAGGYYYLRPRKRFLQNGNFGFGGWCVAPQRQRPNAGVNKKRHFRDRSVL